jgi:hypothetical protein
MRKMEHQKEEVMEMEDWEKEREKEDDKAVDLNQWQKSMCWKCHQGRE